MILSERAMRIEAQAAASSTEAMIAHLKLMIEKLRRELYGQRSERTTRLIDQMELQLEELEAKATEDETLGRGCGAAGLVAGSGATPPSITQAVPGASSARAGRDRSAFVVPVLRLDESCRSSARTSPRPWR